MGRTLSGYRRPHEDRPLLGAGRHQRAAILHAKELGLRVARSTAIPSALALDDADISEVVNFVDIPSAVAFAEKIRPDGV